MVHTESIRCPQCGGDNLQKNGKSINNIQRWHCKECNKFFQREYRYNAYNHGVKERIIEMVLNGSGIRDMGRVLKINKNTVLAVIKKTLKVNPYFLTVVESQTLRKLDVDIKFSGEMDEFWSYWKGKYLEN